ncbi:MAG: hypothetical protein ACTH5M_01045 [Psychrobacter sp.]|uniref:hypothetical protein n=1 Tax=Psychrobacter sp. AOP7-B1-24 TaxID=3457645 RepID=UPI003FB8DE14
MTIKRLSNISYRVSRLLTPMSAVLLSTLATAQIPTLPQQPIPADISQAINSVMAVNYGSDYDKLRGCTLYHRKETFDNERSDYVFEDSYCIAPIKYQVEEVNGGTRLYLLTSGYVYDGNISRADPGIGGLFELYKMGNLWVVSASEPFIYSGGSGRSRHYEFELSEVGENKYGWTGKTCGSGAGGQSNCIWQMYVPIDGKIKTIAEIDADYYSESYSAGRYYEGTGYVSHDYNAPMTAGFYPLNMSLTIKSGKIGSDSNKAPSSEEKSTYKYNVAKQQFELVE